MKNDYDILIVGAGLVGSSLALALSKTSLRIALCESTPLKTTVEPVNHDRILALTYGSACFLQTLGIDSLLASQTTPIHTVHVSHRGHLGITRINATEEHVPALGYVIPAALLGAELNKAVLALPHLTLFNPASVHSLTRTNNKWKIKLTNETITATLVIAADGSRSTVRQLLNIVTETQDYGQSALVTTVKLNRSHQQIAYERFTENGALAMLPLKDQHCGLIWTAPHVQIETLLKLNEIEFLQQAQQCFGYRLGRLLQISKRSSHPLQFLHAKEQTREGLMLIGNAAHTIHPIAAQGFNLGLSSIACLSKLITENWSDPHLLQKYDQLSLANQQQIIRFTNRLTTCFSQDFLPINLIRSSGLLALDLIPPLKSRLAKRLLGRSVALLTERVAGQ